MTHVGALYLCTYQAAAVVYLSGRGSCVRAAALVRQLRSPGITFDESE